MSLTTIQKYTYEGFQKSAQQPFFELMTLQLDTHCIANQSEVADYFKIFWIEDGKGTYQVDFNEFTIEGAGIFCISPGQIFTVKSEEVKSAYQISFDKDFYCIETHGKEIACNGLLFNNVHRATVVEVDANAKPLFQGLIQQMLNELQNKGSAHRELLETYLRMFLIHTLRLLDEQELQQDNNSRQQDPLIQEFIALVERHFKTEHTVSGYAQKLFIAPKSLSKRLNALGYPTPLQIIKDRIVLEAKRNLRFTQLPIKEIAYELGFEDPAYFSRLFSKATGVSPVEYRSQ